jgi:hypothetical protein
MTFSRSNRNDRRRRVIRETIAADSDFAVESARAQRRARRPTIAETSESLATGYRDPGYSQAVRKTCQQRMVQLIPIRKGALALALTVMWSVWGALLLSHYLFHVRGNPSGRSPVLFLQLFDLRSPHSIANWMTCQLWTLTAIVAWTIYRIRKHKLDDYRAKYRVWIFLSLVALFSSFDAATSSLYLLGQSIDGWTRREIGYGGWPLILACYASLVAMLGLKLSSELKPTPSAIVFWFSGLLAWACAALLGTGLLKLNWSPGAIDLMVGGCWLGGVLLVFQAAGMFLRHCYIHAQKRFLERSVMTPSGGIRFQMPKLPSMPSLPKMPWSRSHGDDEEEDLENDDEVKSSRSASPATVAEPSRPMRLFGFIPSREELNAQPTAEPERTDDGGEIDQGLTKTSGWFGIGGNKPVSEPKPVGAPRSSSAPVSPGTPTAAASAASVESKATSSRWLPSLSRAATGKKSSPVKASPTPPASKPKETVNEVDKPKRGWFDFRKHKEPAIAGQSVKPSTKPSTVEKDKSNEAKPVAAKESSKGKGMLGKFSGWLDGLKLKPPVDNAPVKGSVKAGGTTQASGPKPISNSTAPLPSTQPSSSRHDAEEDDEARESDNRYLSKAERKRLRRQQGIDRNAA